MGQMHVLMASVKAKSEALQIPEKVQYLYTVLKGSYNGNQVSLIPYLKHT